MAETDGRATRPRSALWTPWGFGLLYGALAFVAGYLAVATLLLVEVGPSADVIALAGTVVLEGPTGSVASRTVTGVLSALATGGALVAAGYALARGYVGVSTRQAVRAGTAVAAGYVALAVPGAIAAGATTWALPWTAVATGVYAAVCGGLGGYLAAF